MSVRKSILVVIAVLLGACLFALGWVTISHYRRAEPPPSRDVGVPTETHPSPPVREPAQASLLFVGDVLPLEDRDYLANLKPLLTAADLAVCNLECPLSTHGVRNSLKLDESGNALPNEFLFRSPPSQAARLAEAGLDAATLANNHIMDYGADALLETLSVLDEAGLQHAGAGPDADSARQPAICEVKGRKVALLAYVSSRTLPGTDGFAAAEGAPGTVFVDGDETGRPTPGSREMLQHDIATAKRACDFVVVCFHWGTEERDRPDPLPRNLAHWSIDCGADIVVGHHPHVVQGVELYDGRPIAYSIGNFAFSTPWEARRYGAALQVRIREGDWLELALYPVKLAEASGDPSPARSSDLKRIRDRAIRLSAELGTACEYVDDDGGARVVIRNPAQSRQAQPKEGSPFFVEPHPELDGMAVVHFLVWDLVDEEKGARARQVVMCEALAEETCGIFRQIYEDAEQFPIHDLVGYNYRTIPGGTRLSNHALGRAIDINRDENPMIEDGEKIVHPEESPYFPGEWRPGVNPYSIGPDGSVVRAFKQRGWRWGGDWTTCKDYQHFDKPP